jgi:SAM-dependent methyltransferase
MQLLEVQYSGGSDERRQSLLKRAFDLLVYQYKTSGLFVATRMVPTYVWVKFYNKYIVLLSRLLTSTNVICSCCGWEGLKFGTFWGTSRSIKNFACPSCGSHPRHRFLSQYIPKFIDINSLHILHFAPEEFLEKVFKQNGGTDHRTTTDITLPNVSCLSNINYLPFTDESFDSIICIHVLEHIKDDLNAMHELHRVLKTGGTAVICIPETNNEKTVEFGFEDPAKSHHWRDYGLDVKERLTDSGFQVSTVTPKSLGADSNHCGLAEDERFHLCTK